MDSFVCVGGGGSTDTRLTDDEVELVQLLPQLLESPLRVDPPGGGGVKRL